MQSEKEITERKAFRKDFITKVTTDFSTVPASGVLVQDGDNIQEKNNETIAKGIARANDVLTNSDGVPVNLYLTPADKTRLQTFFDNASGGFAEIPDNDMGDILFRSNSSENPGTLLVNSNPIAGFCAQETVDIKCAKEHAGLGDHAHDDTPAPPIVSGDTSGDGITNTDIPTYIGRLLRHMPFPDVVLQPELAEKRADRADIEKAVNDFSLQKGPAEVPSFYDFNVLDVAFDHVWKQLFDESIPNLAYTANTLGKERFGVSNFVSTPVRKRSTAGRNLFCHRSRRGSAGGGQVLRHHQGGIQRHVGAVARAACRHRRLDRRQEQCQRRRLRRHFRRLERPRHERADAACHPVPHRAG